MQREAKEAPVGRKGRCEEVGRLIVEALTRGDKNPLEGLGEFTAEDNVEDVILLVRAHLRTRARRAMGTNGTTG